MKAPKIKKIPKSGSGDYKYYPSISLNEKQLPSVKDWKVGEKYKVILEIKQTGMNLSKDGNKEMASGSFDIVGISDYKYENK